MSDSRDGGCCPVFPWCYVRWYSHGVVSVICPVMFPWWADDQHQVPTPRLHIRRVKPRWVIRTVMSSDKQMRMFCNITPTCWCPGTIITWCSVAFPQWPRRWPIHWSAAAAGSRNEWQRRWRGDGGGWWGSLRSPRHHSPHSETRPRHLTSLWATNMRLEGGIQFVNKLLIDREETRRRQLQCRVLAKS